MDKIITTLALDYIQNRSLQTVNVKQYDDQARQIKIKLYDNGKAVTVTSGVDTALLYASINNTATAVGDECTIKDNAVIVTITAAMTAVAGVSKCEVRITSSSGQVSTATFCLSVEPSAVTSDTPKIVSSADIFNRLSDFDKEQYETFTYFTKNLHRDYELIEQAIVPQAEITSYTFDADWYHNSLTVWKNNMFLKGGFDYTLIQAGIALYQIIFDEPLVVGDKVILQFWNIPQSSSGTVVGEVLSISDGSIAAGISGTAEQVTDEEET